MKACLDSQRTGVQQSFLEGKKLLPEELTDEEKAKLTEEGIPLKLSNSQPELSNTTDIPSHY